MKKPKKEETRPIKWSFRNKQQWLNDLPGEAAILRCKYHFYCSDFWYKAKKENVLEYLNPDKRSRITGYLGNNYVALIFYCKNSVQINLCSDSEYCTKLAERKGAYSYMKSKFSKAIKKYLKENNYEQHL